jgi:predicted esterase
VSVIRFEHLPVRRTARLAMLGHASHAVRQVWIVCHGYAQLASRFVRRFEPIAGPTRLIVAPEALNRFYLEGASKAAGPDSPVGATWMTSDDRETDIADYLAYLDAVHARVFEQVDRAAVRLVVLGFSQGCATASRWVASGTASPDRVVLWSGALPPELALAPTLFGDAALTFVTGRADPLIPEAAVAAHAAKLREAGRPFERRGHAGGHDIDGATLRALADEMEQP